MNLRDALQSVYDQRGLLTPALVVDEARPDDHPLHNRFEWDDSIAGEAYRHQQAHRLITSVRVNIGHDKHGPKDVRAFVAVPTSLPQPNYMPIADAFADDMTQRIVLAEFERALKQLHRRYGHLKEYAQMLRTHLTEDAA
jgi:hypothetical protein